MLLLRSLTVEMSMEPLLQPLPALPVPDVLDAVRPRLHDHIARRPEDFEAVAGGQLSQNSPEDVEAVAGRQLGQKSASMAA